MIQKESGFVAGTLVHTDKGLVPIDQLKFGDMVLSRSEHDPDGPNEYKRVLRTIKSASKQKLSYVKYVVNVDGSNNDDGNRYVFCTENHPFFINKLAYDSDSNSYSLAGRLGWIAAELLGRDYDGAIETLHRDKAFASIAPLMDKDSRILLSAADSGCAGAATDGEGGSGPLFDFRQGRPIAIGGAST